MVGYGGVVLRTEAHILVQANARRSGLKLCGVHSRRSRHFDLFCEKHSVSVSSGKRQKPKGFRDFPTLHVALIIENEKFFPKIDFSSPHNKLLSILPEVLYNKSQIVVNPKD